MTAKTRHLVRLVAGFALLFTVAAHGVAVKPVDPQPGAAALSPGLAVEYYFGFYRHVDEVASQVGSSDAQPGEALPWLNYRVGQDHVLSSDRFDGVGARIHGFIRLEEAGTYSFAVESNDGVRLFIGGEKILEDPDVHADQWSEVGTVEVAAPGWHAIEVLYFERKNTSTLRLVWRKPSADAESRLTLVPKAAYGH